MEKACLVTTRFNGNRFAELGQTDERLVDAASGLWRQRETQHCHFLIREGESLRMETGGWLS